jgi:hypothetical protein
MLRAGAAGLFFEISTPGVVLPGVGGISLLLGLYALQFPGKLCGSGTVVLAIILLSPNQGDQLRPDHRWHHRHDLGSLMLLMPPPLPGLSLWVVVPSTLLVGVFRLPGRRCTRTLGRAHTADARLLKVGMAITPIDQKQGKVFVFEDAGMPAAKNLSQGVGLVMQLDA